jgi:hypothetical protein
MRSGARGIQGHEGMALASPPRMTTAVMIDSAHMSACQWWRMMGAAEKQRRRMREARGGMSGGQGRDRRRRRRIQVRRVKSVSGAREGGEEGEEEMHANDGR